jgi:hypothetical protein
MSETYDYYDDDTDELEDDEAWLDCGLMQNGQCLKAGSEECDWECPYSRGAHYAGSDLWNKRHDAGVPIDGCECSECNSARSKRTTHD